jgi:hypothetical protein
MAIGKVGLCLPRDKWKMLLGGMPYYFVKDEPDTEREQKTTEKDA